KCRANVTSARRFSWQPPYSKRSSHEFQVLTTQKGSGYTIVFLDRADALPESALWQSAKHWKSGFRERTSRIRQGWPYGRCSGQRTRTTFSRSFDGKEQQDRHPVRGFRRAPLATG